MEAHYYPAIFDAPDLQRAQEIILTAEGPGADTATRWAEETPYVLELVRASCAPHAGMVVLDYGCGVGRMAKALIDAHGCFVIGVDIAPTMRALAGPYVGSDRFMALSPEQFDTLVAAGLRVDAALAVWVLQHCFAPATDIARIRRSLAAAARLFVLNMPKRAVPSVLKDGDTARFRWSSDTTDVAGLLRATLTVEAEGVPDPARTPNMADAGAFWLVASAGSRSMPRTS